MSLIFWYPLLFGLAEWPPEGGERGRAPPHFVLGRSQIAHARLHGARGVRARFVPVMSSKPAEREIDVPFSSHGLDSYLGDRIWRMLKVVPVTSDAGENFPMRLIEAACLAVGADCSGLCLWEDRFFHWRQQKVMAASARYQRRCLRMVL